MLCTTIPPPPEKAWRVVLTGETLESTAQAAGVSLLQLVVANPHVDWTALRAGQRVWIGHVHVMRQGETLFDLANAYGTAKVAILEANSYGSFQTPETMRCGSLVRVPNRPHPPYPLLRCVVDKVKGLFLRKV